MLDLKMQLEQLQAEFEASQQNPDEPAIRALEVRAGEFLKASSGSEWNPGALALFKEITTLRRQLAGGRDVAEVDVEKLLRGARVRIRVADATPTDQRYALDFLRQVMEAESDNPDAFALLEELLAQNTNLQDDVQELLAPLEHIVPQAAEVLQRIRSAPDFAAPPLQNEIGALTTRMFDAHYRGEYAAAISLCNQVLELDSRNATAKEYKAKAEDYLERGVVSDARIPPPARIAYNQGVSVQRARLYGEAKNLFNKALQLAGESGIAWWPDAENALLSAEELISAEELRKEGDELARQDHWDEALAKYEDALELAEIPRTRKRYDVLAQVVQAYYETENELSVASAQLIGRAEQIRLLQENIINALGYFPDSQKLLYLNDRVNTHKESILNVQSIKDMSAQARAVFQVDERRRRFQDVFELLGMLQNSQPYNQEVTGLMQQASREVNLLAELERELEQAEWGLQLDRENGIALAYSALEQLGRFANYSDYQRLLRMLLGELLSRSVMSRDHNNLPEAEAFLHQAESLYNLVFCVPRAEEPQDHGPLKQLQEDMSRYLKTHRSRLDLMRALVLAADKQYDSAIHLLERLTADDPENLHFRSELQRVKGAQESQEHLKKGAAFRKTGNVEEAAKEYGEALKLAVLDPTVIELYAEALSLRQRQEQGWSALTGRERAAFVFRLLVLLVLYTASVSLVTAAIVSR